MEAKKVSTQIIDHVDGQPSIVLSNGNWGVFDPKTNMYKDTGIKASPEDDSSAVKYYKLNNVPTPPEAPSQTGGWNTLASLNAALAQAEWEEDPLQTSSTNRFCWIATYGKENIVDTVATEAEGHLVFKPKFTRTNVRLWSNYANSPTISVVGNEIIITNPDGTVIKQKFASTEAINDLTTLINSLQSQVDGAIYSYSMEGVPTLDTLPTTQWRLDSDDIPITDPSTIADIYRTHVGDTYTDTLTYFSYRFSQTGTSSSNPLHYEWKIIENDALTAALGEIANLGREKITIFTEQPNSPYKKGDMWLDGDVMLHAIQSSDVFNLAHWVQPYATKVELDAVETALQAAAADATLANQNLATLESNLTNMTGTVADAIKDNIISDTELMDLESELKQLDIDQETLLTTVNYLLNSIYLPATPKATLQTRSNNSIAVGGSMDIYQAQVTAMIADRVITEQERADYLSKFNTYKTDLKLLNEAISGASSAIEGELKRLADEKVDNIEIGGRNLVIISTSVEGKYVHPSTGELSSSGAGASATDWIKVSPNSYYTYSVFPTIQIYPGKVEYTIDKEYISGYEKNQPVANGLFVDTFKTSPTTHYIRVANGALERTKLEKGTKATDWTPAPEDTQADIDAAKKAGTDASAEVVTMGNSLTTMVNTVTDALEDKVIDEAERKTLIAEQKTLDTEQERLLALVNSLLESAYLVGDANTALSNASDVTLKASTGTLDVYQMTIDVMINADKITAAMISAYEGAYDNHKNGLSSLNVAIENARKAIDIEVERLSDAKVDEAVIKATYWSIKASTPVIYKDSNSATASGVHTPVTVNGELRSGTTTTQGGFISIQPNGGAESTATASPRTIAPTDAEGKTSYTVRLYEKADKATLLDTMTIPVVFKGSSGINVAMSNEADVLPASPTGEVSDYADTGNVIRVFEGSNELAYTKPTTAIVNGVSVDISAKNAQNLVENGDFRNGLSGWLGSNISIVSEKLNITKGNNILVEYKLNYILNNKYYVKLNGVETDMPDYYVYMSSFTRLNTPGGSAIHIPSSSGNTISIGRAVYTSGTYLRIRDIIIINLTATFGAGNEPTKEECDKIFGGYFEGTAPLSDVALGGNGTYQVYTSPTGITEGTKSVSGLACSFANASNMTTDSAKITFNIKGLSSSGEPFEFSKAQNFSKSKIGADGADGEGGINVMITRQGSFRTYWRQIGDQGQILTTPEKVSEIVGGVEIGGVEYVQCKVFIYKGSIDVTASALADPTTLPKWYLNNELMGSVTDTLNIPIIHADGVDDEVRFEYTDTNAKNWEGV